MLTKRIWRPPVAKRAPRAYNSHPWISQRSRWRAGPRSSRARAGGSGGGRRPGPPARGPRAAAPAPGGALALGLAGAGAAVVVTDIEEGAAARVAEAAATLGVTARAQALDVTRPEAIERVVAWSEREVGPLDVLVNNAGVRDETADALATTVEDWDRVFAVNVRGPLLLSHAAARRT